MRSISHTSTPMPAITAACPGRARRAALARPARVARMGVARRRLDLAVRLPALGEEIALVDAVIDEVPRQRLVELVCAMHEPIGVHQVVPAPPEPPPRRPPGCRIAVQAREDRADATIAAREERLQVGLSRALGLDLDGGHGAQLAAHARELSLQRAEVFHGLPLERRPGLGCEWIDRHEDAADR